MTGWLVNPATKDAAHWDQITNAEKATFRVGSPKGRLAVDLGFKICRSSNALKLRHRTPVLDYRRLLLLLLRLRGTLGRLGIDVGTLHGSHGRRGVRILTTAVWIDRRELGRRLTGVVIRVLLRGIVRRAGGRLPLRGLLRKLACATRLGAVWRRRGQNLHGRVSLGGSRRLLLEVGRATARGELLVMRPHRVLSAGVHGGVGIMRILHRDVAVTVVQKGARHRRRCRRRRLVRVQAALVVVVLEARRGLLRRVLGTATKVPRRHLAASVSIVPSLAAGAGRVVVRLPLLHGCCFWKQLGRQRSWIVCCDGVVLYFVCVAARHRQGK